MRGKLATVAVLTVALAACMSDGTPATAPPSTVTSGTTVPTTLAPATTTTTTVATTTTLDRLTEIEEVFQDLEERRLQALYDGDREAFRALFANAEYMERSMGVFDIIEFVGEPVVEVEVLRVLADGVRCVAANVRIDATQSLGPSAVAESLWVIQRSDSNGWGYSYGGEGWICDGPHPFS